jgi:RNA polymerase sigma factor (sigma-70 family)
METENRRTPAMTPPMTRLLHRLRRDATPGETAPDADLLVRFARGRDESAFAALVARHGGMVLNVCRRVLGDAHEAEDACQAAFLVLGRKAGSLRRPEALAGWLRGVAYRVALKARAAAGRRGGRDLAGAPEPRDPRPDPLAELSARDLLLAVEAEVQRLPESQRLPVALCCLDGLSQEEAAARLGWKPGALKGRLERGRSRLHQRLTRRGLTLAAALAAAEASRGAAAGLPAALAGPTARAALAFAAGAGAVGVSDEVVALAKEGLQSMSCSKLKSVLVVLAVVGLAGGGAGWLAVGRGGDRPAGAQAARPRPAAGGAGPEKPADQLARARRELAILADKAERDDEELSESVVRARQKLVELEERLREAQAEARAARAPDAEEERLRREMERLEAAIARVEETSPTPEVKRESLVKLVKQLDRARDRLTAAEIKRRAVADRGTARLIKLRQELVREEESVRRLERKRDLAREEAERRREDAAARVRRLEGGAAPEGADRGRALERKLDALRRELEELRREVRRLRGGREE